MFSLKKYEYVCINIELIWTESESVVELKTEHQGVKNLIAEHIRESLRYKIGYSVSLYSLRSF